MFKSKFSRLAVMFMLMVAGGFAWAAVSSDPVSGSAGAGVTIQFPLRLQSPQSVGGINGELVFDPSLFTNVQIEPGPGAPNFICLGNLVSPGHYKFVVYSDPVGKIATGATAAFFKVTTAAKIDKSVLGKLTYTSTAASDTNANALGASFAAVQIKLQGNAANAWSLYE